ncbi:hypothetical protein OH76DRAFT_185471 [Lentinus brumalis]|uniref:Uncharacterized protein n=1 Tax=Lentinus brumalis TaxID=2498619 RepID=A0A371CNA7_9APHY|nr:hypothetical protein OH76DRAFT_185471 [Polyporus brumalis]
MGSARRCTPTAPSAALFRYHYPPQRSANVRSSSTKPCALCDARNTTGVVGNVANKVNLELIQHPSPRRQPRGRATQSDSFAAPPTTSPTRATSPERVRSSRDRRAGRHTELDSRAPLRPPSPSYGFRNYFRTCAVPSGPLRYTLLSDYVPSHSYTIRPISYAPS